MDSVIQSLAKLDIQPLVVSHSSVTASDDRGTALSNNAASPKTFELSKTSIFQTKSLDVVILFACESTSTNTAILGKALSLKQLRTASEHEVSEIFSLDRDFLSPFSLNHESFCKTIIAVDASMASASMYAFGLSSTQTIFLSGQDVISYLRLFETDTKKVRMIDSESQAVQIDTAERTVQIAIGVKKDVDFSSWYTNVLLKSEMMEYYSVSGCYILRPWSYSIWEAVKAWLDKELQELEVSNSYFPIFLPQKVLELEKEHVEGFSPEVAWVTRAGQSELEESLAIRPTSETGMYPYFSKWIKSHRDLPLKLNQWNSVVRWEFKTPQPFIRTREFLWQEGHTAHLTKEEADFEVLQILDLYRRVYSELLAVPVIPGTKSDKEKFAGGLYTTTVEAFIPTTGRAVQGATAHSLGQNFSRAKMFNINVEDPSDATGQSKTYVWQNSWGLSTRVIGVMVMVHGDNQGLVLPPRIASIQVIIVPCGITVKSGETTRARINAACEDLARALKTAGIRAKADFRDGYTPGYKFNYWEQKGVPVRLEIGPKDLDLNQTLSVRRDNGVKNAISLHEICATVASLLETIQSDMLHRASDEFNARLRIVHHWNDLISTLDRKCIGVMPWCERTVCEEDIKDRSSTSAQDERAPSAGAKSLCIPFDQSRWGKLSDSAKCVACSTDAKRWTLFGRSY
ncbi:prolyl-tRNA synthetase [Mycena floridula]|nr:prolyl-tRNA synthetase [Mycena floridula]